MPRGMTTNEPRRSADAPPAEQAADSAYEGNVERGPPSRGHIPLRESHGSSARTAGRRQTATLLPLVRFARRSGFRWTDERCYGDRS